MLTSPAPPRSGRLGRPCWLPALATALLLLAPVGAAQAFAGLTVTPAGGQEYEVGTGVTRLPDGGTVVDKASDVALTASYIEYVEGEHLTATGAVVEGGFGTVTADEIQLDLAAGVLTALGSVTLHRAELVLTAQSLTYRSADQVALFSGGVASSEPRFTSDTLFLDFLTGNVLLSGRYAYDGGLLLMESPESGGLLQLTVTEVGGAFVYDAATEVEPALLARFEPFL